MKFKRFFAALLLFLPLQMQAKGVRTLFMSTIFYTAGRTPLETKLPQTTAPDRGPVFNFTTGKAVVNGRTLTLSTIKCFTFDMRVVDGIAEMPTAMDEARNLRIYSVNGQLVRDHANNLEGLSKGIYIVNGKKYIVK